METGCGSFDLGNWTAENMEPLADVGFLTRPDPQWRKRDSFESILYDLLTTESQVNAQNGDHLKPNQYFWHYVEDVDTDGNIRHFAVNNPERVIKEEDGALSPVDDAGNQITTQKSPDESGSPATGCCPGGLLQQTLDYAEESKSTGTDTLMMDPVDEMDAIPPEEATEPIEVKKRRVTGGAVIANDAAKEPRRRSRRLEQRQVGPLCRQIGIQHQEIQRPGLSDGVKLPGRMMTMGVVFEIAEHMKRLGQPRNALIRCLEHLFNVQDYNWRSARFVSRFYRSLSKSESEREQIEHDRAKLEAFNSLPFRIPDGTAASKRMQQLKNQCHLLKQRVKQLVRINQLLTKRLLTQKRSRNRWNTF